MKFKQDYLFLDSTPPLRGLATTPVSTRLAPEYSPDLLNCVVRDGKVMRRAGYQKLGRTLVGRVMAITEFGEIGEDPYFVVLTSHRQYAYDPGTEDFVDLTPGQVSHAITAVNLVANKITIAGDQTASATAGRLIPIIGGANEGVYTIVGSVLDTGNTVIELTETLASATVAGNVVFATDWDTDAYAQIDYVRAVDVSGARLIITNGSDSPRKWDGDIGTPFSTWAPNYPDFVSCKTLAVHVEHLFMGGVVTATATSPQLIAWSDSGDFDEFVAGASGEQLIYQVTEIIGLKVLGDRLAVYSPDTIVTGVFVDLPVVFAFEVVIPEGTRLVNGKAITSINVGHIYMSEENIYLFDGSRGLRVLGEMIYSDYKARKDYQNFHLATAFNDYAKRTLYMAIPDIEGGALVYTCEYDVFDLSSVVWAKEKYAHAPRVFGFFVNRTETLTWDDASWEPTDMPWEDELGSWVEEAEQLQFPIRCFGTNNGEVFLVTEGVLNDNGTTVVQYYETKDFMLPDAFQSLYGRWGEIEFEGYGSEVIVSASGDLGHNFSTPETIELTSSPTTYRVPVDLTSRTLRVRFESEVDFALRWVRLWVRPGGPR